MVNREVKQEVFTEADGQEEFHLWEFAFRDKHDYNSIYRESSARYKII